MGRGPGAGLGAALPPARAWQETRAAPCPRQGGARMATWERWKAGVAWPRSVARLAGAPRRSPAQTRAGTAGAFQGGFLSLRAALCAWRSACALPAGGAGPSRRARPSLRQWVWTRVGEKGGQAVPPPTATPPPFFPPCRRRGAIFFAAITSLCDQAEVVARLRELGRGLTVKGEGYQPGNLCVLILRE